MLDVIIFGFFLGEFIIFGGRLGLGKLVVVLFMVFNVVW